MDKINDTAAAERSGHHLVEKLLQVAKLTRIYVEIAVRVADLHAGQDELIRILTTKPTLSVSELASKLNVRTSTVSKMVDCLSKNGLVERIPDALDHRRTGVVLTARGVEMQSLVHEIWRGAEQNLFGGLSGAEIEEISGSLELLNGRLKERLARLR